MQQGLGVKCVHNRWAYATYTLLLMHEIGQNHAKTGGGLTLRHGRTLRILQYILNMTIILTSGVYLYHNYAPI